VKSRQLSFYIIFLLIIILSFFLFNPAYSQEIVNKNHAFSLKKNIHNISYEPINGFGYSYSRKIKPDKYLGVGIHEAYTQVSNMNKFGYSISKKRKEAYYELLRLNIFYRKIIKSKNYFDVGTQISAGASLGGMEDSYLFYGVYSSFFYGFKYFKIGHGLQIGIIKGNQYKYSGFVLTLSPIILQYTFTH